MLSLAFSIFSGALSALNLTAFTSLPPFLLILPSGFVGPFFGGAFLPDFFYFSSSSFYLRVFGLVYWNILSGKAKSL
jgi:hypothetical protein